MRVLRVVLAVASAVIIRAQPVAVAPDALGVPELLAQFKVPAVSVAVIRDFKIDWAMAWGVKSARTGEAATADTLFQAASISKPVAAMASSPPCVGAEGRFRSNRTSTASSNRGAVAPNRRKARS